MKTLLLKSGLRLNPTPVTMKSLLRPSLLGLILVLAAFHSPAANRTWDGGDLDLPTFWSARTNWNGNTNIATGDTLFFPGTAVVKTMDNNLSISNFAKLTFNDDAYTLNGNSLRLTNGITANYTPTGPTRINVGITLGDDAAFEADDSSATLELNGPVNLLGFVLTNQGAGTVTWLAPFRSTAGGIVRKREIGTTIVRSTNANFLGTVEVSGGDFVVNGRMTAGAITVNSGGTLAGAGLVHAVTVNNSGVIAPNGAARGVLTVTNRLTLLPRGIYEAEILGATAGLFDQLNVLGTVSLTNAALNLTVNFVPVSPTAITIIANDGADAVLGTFSGLPQGATVLVTDFIRATISYTGGTGNDVAITVSPLDTLTWTGSASGLWSVGANWVGGVAPQPGDSLVFPVVNIRKQATNDFAADTVFGLIRYETNYTLAGARAALRRGFHSFHASPGSGFLALPLRLAAAQTFTNQFQDLSFLGGIDLGGFGLTFRNGAVSVANTVNSEISGVGTVTHAGAGELVLEHSNSFTGVLVAQESVLVEHPAALGTPAQATLVGTNGQLTLSTRLPPAGDMAEPLQLSGAWQVHATNMTWSGNVTFEHPQVAIQVLTNRTFTLTSATLGTNGFTKFGPGTLRLATIQSAHGGTTFVKEGTLQVDTAMTNSALVVSNRATLTGTGTVRQATFLAGATFSPAGEGFGDGASSSATMIVTQSLAFQGASVLRVNVNGPSANSYDQVDVFGTVNLGAGTATLDVALGYSAAVGDSFTILDNDGADAVTGFFAGWPEGATNVVDGHSLTIAYTAGTGNDIRLTKVSGTRTWTGLGTNDFWSTPQNWTGNFAPEPRDRLVFPATALRRNNVNDYPAGTPFHSLSVTSRYELNGAEIGLLAGMNAVSSGTPGTQIDLPLTLLASQTFALSNSAFQAVLSEGVQLGAHTLTVEVSGSHGVTVGHVSGAGSLVKTGPTGLSLPVSNSYSGLTVVREGTLFFQQAEGLGTGAGGTVVSNGATLHFYSSPFGMITHTITEPLTLAGELFLVMEAGGVVWNAPMLVQSNAVISLSGNDPSDVVVTFQQGLSGAGPLTLRPSADRPRTVLLPGTNSISGSVFASEITLEVNGSMPNASLVLQSSVARSATLTGTGLVRALNVAPESILSPAGTNGGDGTISTLTVTQSLVMGATSTYRVNLNGLNVQNYDQLDVLGTVNLSPGVANLDVQLGFTPPEGHSFIILDNDGADAITGTFAGKPQGAIFTANGQRLQISYTGGTGNDIALTVLGPEELTWTGAGGNRFWSTPGNWIPARSPQDGDRLIFPGGTPRALMNNNVPDLDLHSLRFAGAGASNNNFQVEDFSHPIFVANGIAVTNPVSAEFKMQVVLTAPQTLVTRGLLAFDDRLNAQDGVTVVGNSTFRVEGAAGGPYRGTGGTWDLTGASSFGGGSTIGIGLSNVFLNYGAQQFGGGASRLTNSTFRLNATNASVNGLLLANSLLDVVSTSIPEPDIFLHCRGDLEFLGASRLAFDYHASRRPLVEVTGDVQLNNAILVVGDITAAFGVPITVLRNGGTNPVAGTFNGLPEGAGLFSANGTPLVISYVGGDSGSDVTLTPISPATGVTRVWRGLAANGDWSQPGNWVSSLVPADGDSVEFPDAPKPANTNNLPAVRYNQLRFTGTSGVARVLAPNTNSPLGLQLFGGLDYRDTGTLRISVTNAGFLSPRGLVQVLAPQTFHVGPGGTVNIAGLIGVPGAVVTKTGGGELELGFNGSVFSLVGAPMRQQEGTLRIFETDALIEQTGGTLEVQTEARQVNLFGGAFQTAPIATNDGVRVTQLDAGGATNLVVIRPGGEGAAGRLTVTNSLTLNSNVTLRMDIANAVSFLGSSGAADDLIDLGDSGDFHFNNARLELNFLPGFQLSPTNFFLIVLSQNARTNSGSFAGLPHLGLLTNQLGVLRISYRDFVLPPPFNIFGNATNQGMVILERIVARPVMLAVTNGPGAFKTVTALGTPGALYVIEGSEDLENWTAIGAETSSPITGLFSFTDVTPFEHRFYRAALP